MIRPLLRPACLLFVLSLAGTLAAADWKPLFNGKDLSGWQPEGGSKDSWHVEDDMLYCSGGGGGWLSTDKEYANFELELEFRLPAHGNSGVFLRAPKKATGPTRAWKFRCSTTKATPASSPGSTAAAFTAWWRPNLGR